MRDRFAPNPSADLFAAAWTGRKPAAKARIAASAGDAAERDDRSHACAVCGGPAGFGFGVFLRKGKPGRWACAAHRAEVEAMT